MFERYRLSPTEDRCVEGWTGSEWVPDSWFLTKEDAVVHLVMDRNEGTTVELTDKMIADALHNLRCEAKHIARCISLLTSEKDN